jgi:hypothetical protein
MMKLSLSKILYNMQPILPINQQHTLGKHQVYEISFFYFLDCWVEFSAHLDSPATGHLSISFLVFLSVLKQMLRGFAKFQVATACYSCNTLNLNLSKLIPLF